MPESSHKDVNLRLTQALVQAACYRPWHWVPAIHAGMTDYISV
ncbi:MAG: hypothetical protein WCI11_11805 [Candidatus Methylumidiphilus sp.]